MEPDTRKKVFATALGIAAFFAAGPVSRGLRRRFPESPFAAQVIIGGSLAVGAYAFAKALLPDNHRAPEAVLSRSWGVFGGAYQAMKNANEGYD
jgi:hypothetical protein